MLTNATEGRTCIHYLVGLLRQDKTRKDELKALWKKLREAVKQGNFPHYAPLFQDPHFLVLYLCDALMSHAEGLQSASAFLFFVEVLAIFEVPKPEQVRLRLCMVVCVCLCR